MRPEIVFDRVSSTSSAAYDGSTEPLVSVVVSTFNRQSLLLALLEALESQSFDTAHFEVILVDNGSTDDTWTRIADCTRRTPLRLLALRLEENRGAGTGRNAGVRACRAPIVAFTDDDCLPTPGWLETLTRPLRNGASPELAHLVVQGRTIPWGGDREGIGSWARTMWILGPTWLFETCNVAYRLVDLESAGAFLARRIHLRPPGNAPSVRMPNWDGGS